MRFHYYLVFSFLFSFFSVDDVFSQCCGDGVCDLGEDITTCPSDCGGPSFNCPNTIGSFFDSPIHPTPLADAQNNGWCYTVDRSLGKVCFEYRVPPSGQTAGLSFHRPGGGTYQLSPTGACNTMNNTGNGITAWETFDNNCNLVSNNMMTGAWNCFPPGDIITVCLTLSGVGTIEVCPIFSCGTEECATQNTNVLVCPEFSGFTSSGSFVDVCDSTSGVVSVTPDCGTHYSYVWNDPSASTNPSATGLSPGTYNVEITNTAFPTCDTTMSVTLALTGLQLQDTPTLPSCPGECDGSIDVVVTGGSGTYTYTWTDSQGNPIGGNNATLSNICAGSYFVEVEDQAGDLCMISDSIVVSDPTTSIAFTFDDFCEGTANGPAGITPAGGTFSFHPNPSDGATIDPSTGIISDGVGGTTYTVQYSVSITPCTYSVTRAVEVLDAPEPVITGDLSICEGTTTTLDAGSGYTDYNWSTGATTSTIVTGAATNITVTVESANGCQGTSDPVTVVEIADVVTNSVVEICIGESAVIHGNTETVPAIYTHTFTSSEGCDSTSNVQLIVNPLPTPVITGSLVYCPGDAAVLNAGGPYLSYVWSTGDSTQVISTTATGPISVTVTELNNCSATSSSVSLVAPPVAVLSATPTTGDAPLSVIFTNSSINATNYYWNFGNDSTLAINNTSSQYQTYTNLGNYVVTLIAEENGCYDTATVVIVVQPFNVHFPNIFTPNGDNVNDFFTFNGQNVQSLEVVILNRWGSEVFQSTDVNFIWDGTVGGNLAPEGVYFYKYKITSFSGEIIEGHDFVHLER